MSMFKSNSKPGHNHGHNQTQQQLEIQEQLIDQNFAIHNFMMLLSTFQSLCNALQNKQNNPQNLDQKRYKQFDHVDYSVKNINELKDQAQTQLLSFQQSRILWNKKYGKNTYTLPNSFNKERVEKQLQFFFNVFKEKNDPDCPQMIKQAYQIMFKDIQKPIVPDRIFCQYNQEMNQQNNQQMINSAMFAGNVMREQKRTFAQKKITRAQDIPIEVEPPQEQQQNHGKLCQEQQYSGPQQNLSQHCQEPGYQNQEPTQQPNNQKSMTQTTSQNQNHRHH